MKNKPFLVAIIALAAAFAILLAGCTQQLLVTQQPTEQAAQQPPPVEPAQAADIPEITQAEQSVQEIGTEELDETSSDIDTLILP